MARERITDGFYDEQQSLFALGVLNFSMWFVALVNRKKNKPTFLLSSIIISGHFIEWEDHVNILAVESLLFSNFFFLPKKSLVV